MNVNAKSKKKQHQRKCKILTNKNDIIFFNRKNHAKFKINIFLKHHTSLQKHTHNIFRGIITLVFFFY